MDWLTSLRVVKTGREQTVKYHLTGVMLFRYYTVAAYKWIEVTALTEMESYRTSSLELRSKGLLSDITQAAKDVHEKVRELLETS